MASSQAAELDPLSYPYAAHKAVHTLSPHTRPWRDLHSLFTRAQIRSRVNSNPHLINSDAKMKARTWCWELRSLAAKDACGQMAHGGFFRDSWLEAGDCLGGGRHYGMGELGECERRSYCAGSRPWRLYKLRPWEVKMILPNRAH